MAARETYFSRHESSNIDKHQMQLAVGLERPAIDVGSLMQEYVRTQEPGLPSVNLPAVWVRERTKDALMVGEEPYVEPLDSRSSTVFRVALRLLLNEPSILDPQPLLPLLERMIHEVDEVVGRLGTFL